MLWGLVLVKENRAAFAVEVSYKPEVIPVTLVAHLSQNHRHPAAPDSRDTRAPICS